MATILITGAAGFIGSHTADLLLAGGHVVVGVDDFRTGRSENLQSALKQAGFRLVRGDVSEPGLLGRLAAEIRPDAIIHLAALVSVVESLRDPGLNFRLNVHAAHEAGEAARLAGVRRLVFASSAAVYGDSSRLPLSEDDGKHPISPYGAAKLASEALLQGHGAAFGISVLGLRYFNVYGPRQRADSPYSGVISIFTRCFREGSPVTVFGDGRQTRDFISVRDVARANALAALSDRLECASINICTGRETSLLDLLDVFERSFPGAPPALMEPPRPGDILRSCGDPAAAARRIGFSAEIPPSQGIADLLKDV